MCKMSLFYFLKLKIFSNKIPNDFCLEIIYIISISSSLYKKSKIYYSNHTDMY